MARAVEWSATEPADSLAAARRIKSKSRAVARVVAGAVVAKGMEAVSSAATAAAATAAIVGAAMPTVGAAAPPVASGAAASLAMAAAVKGVGSQGGCHTSNCRSIASAGSGIVGADALTVAVTMLAVAVVAVSTTDPAGG